MKTRYKLLLAITMVLILISQSFSFLIKAYITNHSTELIGSKIEIEQLKFNPIKCSFTFTNSKLYESNNKDVFAHINHLYIDLSPWKLRNNEYSISEILLDGVNLAISRESEHFNFETLFLPLKKDQDSLSSEPIKYALYNINILHSSIRFHDKTTDKHLLFENLNLRLPELAWNNAQSKVGMDLNLGEKGKMYLDAHMDDNKDTYTLYCRVDQFDLNSIENYFTEYIDLKTLTGTLAFDYTLEGSLRNMDDIKISGKATINDLAIYDQNNDELATAKKIDADLLYYKPTRSAFYFRSIKLSEPKTTLLFDEESNNWSRFLASRQKQEGNQNSELSYIIRLCSVENGSLTLNNKRISPELNTQIDHINGTLTNIGNQEAVISAKYSGHITQGGTLNGTANFSILHPEKWELNTLLKDLPMVHYSAYSQYYFARPLLNGFLSYEFSLNMNNKHAINQNNFTIANPIFGEKTSNNTAYNVPVRTAFNLLKDKHNVVRFNIPIKGNTSDPEFILSEEIKIAIKEYLTQAAKTKAKKVVQSISDLDKKAEIITLNYGEIKFPFKQDVILSQVADRVKSGDVKKLIFLQSTHPEIEKEYLALQEVKLLYLKSKQRSSSNNDAILKMKLKLLSDSKPALIQYINQQTTLNSNASINQKCVDIVGLDRMNKLVKELMEARNTHLASQLQNKYNLHPNDFEIKMGNLSNTSPLSSPQYELEEIMGGSKLGVQFGEDF